MVRRFLLGAVIRTLIVLPFAPSIYALWIAGPSCIGAPKEARCFAEIAAIAPFVLMLGPIAHENGPPPNPYPGIISIALIAGLMGQSASNGFRYARKRRENSK